MASHAMWDAGAIGMVLVPALCDGVVENPFMHMKVVPGWARLMLTIRGLLGLPLFLASQTLGARDNNPLQDLASASKRDKMSPGKLSYWSGSIPIAKVIIPLVKNDAVQLNLYLRFQLVKNGCTYCKI
jgi:hypothetical protein